MQLRQKTGAIGMIAVALTSSSACDGGSNRGAASVSKPLMHVATRATIVARPSDCFGCDRLFTEWVLLRQRQPTVVTLLLTRSPTPGERRELTLQRVSEDGVIVEAPPDSLPFVTVWVADSLIGQGPLAGSAPLLSAVREALGTGK